MYKMKELKVGERVTITLEAVEAVKSKGYDGCFFDRNGGCVAISLGMECVPKYRSDKKNVIFKEVKEQKRKMKEDKHSLKISRSCGNTTLDGYPIATYSNDELKILKNLLEKVLCEVNGYIHL